MVNTRSIAKSTSDKETTQTDSENTTATTTTTTTETTSGTNTSGVDTDETSREETSTPDKTTKPQDPRSRAPSVASSKSSKVSSKKHRRELLKAKEKLLQQQIDLNATRIALLEEESDVDSEEDDTIVNTNLERTEKWVNRSTLALTMKPHHEEPEQIKDVGASTSIPTNRTLPEPCKVASSYRDPAVPTHAEPTQSLREEDPASNPTKTYQQEDRCTSQPCTHEQLQPVRSHYEPEPRNTFNYKELAAAITLAAKSVQPAIAPRQISELPIFTGASSEWLPFKAAYEESANYLTEQDNLSRLRRSLKGAAREAVQCLFIGTTTTAEVMKLLSTRFGRPDALVMAEIEKLRNLQKISENPKDICILASRVTNITATVKALNRVHYLYNPEIVRHVVEKLPPTLRYDCYNYIAEQSDDIPDVIKLTEFLQRAATRCSRFAPAEITTNDRREPTATPFKKFSRTYHIDTNKSSSTPSCPVCNTEDHQPSSCPKMKKAEVSTRWQLAKKHRLCFRCLKIRKFRHTCKPKKCEAVGCRHLHHPLLHNYELQSTTITEVTDQDTTPEHDVVTSTKEIRNSTGLLKILPVRVTGPKGSLDTFALLDDGSTCTLIETSIAEQIGVSGPPSPFYIEGVAGVKIHAIESRRVKFRISGQDSEEHEISARTVDDLGLSPQSISSDLLEDCQHLQDIREQLVYNRGTATILVGQDNWELLITQSFKSGRRGQPVAALTSLGWVLHGLQYKNKETHRINHMIPQEDETSMEKMMKEHFALEALGVEKKKSYTEDERRALQQLEKNTRLLPAGGYETCLLWKHDEPIIPNNYENAVRRLEMIERKLDRDEELKQRYYKQMQILLNNGYAEEAPPTRNNKNTWYLPHFAVVNPQKPEKLRIVHDAAARTKGISLNDMLLPGPDLLQSLPGVLMRFRQHRIAVSADIKDMFMRVHIREEDRDMQRFLWREDRRVGPPTEYRMRSVIFGATSSPCTAIYIKNKNAERFKHDYAEAAEAVIRNHYVDDYLSSYETEEETIRISQQVDKIHKQANYHLQKWSSNSKTVLTTLSTASSEDPQQLQLDPSKILGMVWNPQLDTLSFNLNKARIPEEILNNERTPTKRQALRTVMSIYDPLGLATPVTVQAKRILQEVWRSGIDWDEEIQDKETREWKIWIEHIQQLPLLHIPRCYSRLSEARTREVHVFVDASSSAYAAAVYWRNTDDQGNVNVSLISGKGRVAQLNKLVSIPRLELQAAVLGCRLATSAIEEHDLHPTRRVYWSDSKTVLTWLRNGPRTYKPFVAHRIAEISDTTKTKEWRWVPTKENVADDATRDIPNNFDSNHRWFHGPPFLRLSEEYWPREETTNELESTGEERIHVTTVTTRLSEALPDITRFSQWLRVMRTTARVLQFIELLRSKKQHVLHYKRTKKTENRDPTWNKNTSTPTTTSYEHNSKKQTEKKYIHIEARHMHEAQTLWLRSQQEDAFIEEIRALKKNITPQRSSRLYKLSMQLDNEGVIRLKSRITMTIDISRSQREPAILDGKHQWTRLYIAWVHKQLHHGGFETTTNEVRQHFCVLKLRNTVRNELKKCLVCRIRKATPPQPSTGNHPHTRLAHHQRPFTYTGLDFFGPMMVTVGRTRQKRYGVLFTCLTTRAVHLEIASSLSTDSAIMALRRFIGRRGCPAELHSDNGTNLKGADAELKKSALAAMEEDASCRFIQWRYIPPSAPFMGGAWERLVRSVKTALHTTLHERAPKEEVLATLMIEAEHTINSRPLTHVSTSPDDEEALTPNHFLLGAPSRVPMPGVFTEEDAAGRKDWRSSQRLADVFWSRWVREYLPELQHRREPRAANGEVKLHDLVLIADGTLPRNCWPRGVIVATYPGPDGEIRTVDVRTNKGTLRRPVKKLVVLPA